MKSVNNWIIEVKINPADDIFVKFLCREGIIVRRIINQIPVHRDADQKESWSENVTRRAETSQPSYINSAGPLARGTMLIKS